MFAVQHRAYRSAMVLQLSAIDNQTEAGHLATLYEPVITGLGNGQMSFRGIERVQGLDGVTGYAQEWRITVEVGEAMTRGEEPSIQCDG